MDRMLSADVSSAGPKPTTQATMSTASRKGASCRGWITGRSATLVAVTKPVMAVAKA